MPGFPTEWRNSPAHARSGISRDRAHLIGRCKRRARQIEAGISEKGMNAMNEQSTAYWSLNVRLETGYRYEDDVVIGTETGLFHVK